MVLLLLGLDYWSRHSRGSGDDTALNGIELACGNGSTITSTVGEWGKWGNWKTCPSGSLLNGFSMRSESDQGNFNDDTGANDLIMYCKNPNTGVETVLDNAGGTTWGDWGAKITCPSNTYIGFIQTQVEKCLLECGDDTSLNNVVFLCLNI